MKHKLLICLAAVVGVAVLLWAAGRISRRHTPPSCIVLISLDTVRPDHLGCYGYTKRPTSPNLDRFAESAALFLQSRAQAPWTLPSHMSLFTSMLPSHNRVEDINQKLPDDIPALMEILKKAGYQTAAFVNNGQMKPHWGFGRGFDVWREFEVDTPAGSAENITTEALQWMKQAPRKPYFLFLHYYDAHDPYTAPSPFREQFGVKLSAEETRKITWEHQRPGQDFSDPALLEQIRAAYDAGIAYLDSHLGRILAALPSDALVVVFSDHGEAFKEHGWTLHGASLYEEEIRTALMVRPPKPSDKGHRIADPVMLLDVAPTILGYAGITPPATYEGCDLRPAITGKPLPPRLHFAETKRVLEGRILKAVMTPPAKLIYSLPDGGMESYELPDEMKNRPDSRATPILRDAVRKWVQEESYWLVHLRGEGQHNLGLKVPKGRVTIFVPFGLSMESESIDFSEDGREFRWGCYPGREGKWLFLQTSPADAAVEFLSDAGDGKSEGNVFVGTGSNEWRKASRLPVELRGDEPAADPFITQTFRAPEDGIYIRRYRMPGTASRAAANVKLDEKTLNQLRSLGYVK